MVSVQDIAAQIVQLNPGLTVMKLHKLVYYSQVWHLVWDEQPLFSESIEGWANGPVVPALWDHHRGMFQVDSWIGDPSDLSPSEKETVEIVVKFYGHYTAQWLGDLIRSEYPWKKARHGLASNKRGDVAIEHSWMHEYYSSLAK